MECAKFSLAPYQAKITMFECVLGHADCVRVILRSWFCFKIRAEQLSIPCASACVLFWNHHRRAMLQPSLLFFWRFPLKTSCGISVGTPGNPFSFCSHSFKQLRVAGWSGVRSKRNDISPMRQNLQQCLGVSFATFICFLPMNPPTLAPAQISIAEEALDFGARLVCCPIWQL